MLKSLLTIGFFALVLPAPASRLTVHVEGERKSTPVVFLPDGSERPVVLDADGRGSLVLDHRTPLYVKLGYNYATRLLWLTPEAEVHVRFTADAFPAQVETDGDHADVNRSLAPGRYLATQINDTGASEGVFIDRTDSLLACNLQRMDASGLPEAFRRKEAQRLKYFTWRTLPAYPTFHVRIARDTVYRPSDRYWKQLEELAVPDSALLDLEDYQTFMAEATGRLSTREFPGLDGMARLTAYLEAHRIPARVAEYLVYRKLEGYLRSNDRKRTSASLEAYRRYVTDPQMKARTDSLLGQLARLEAGAPSPDFACTDINGNPVSLASLKGRFLYIDIWATWCGPCQKEIPHLEKLAERYREKDIDFVSISCDNSIEAWKKRVITGRMKGIQLHFPPGNDFMKQYLIEGIPRFILLDREGRILEADMTRPSDPTTTARLDKLFE